MQQCIQLILRSHVKRRCAGAGAGLVQRHHSTPGRPLRLHVAAEELHPGRATATTCVLRQTCMRHQDGLEPHRKAAHACPAEPDRSISNL